MRKAQRKIFCLLPLRSIDGIALTENIHTANLYSVHPLTPQKEMLRTLKLAVLALLTGLFLQTCVAEETLRYVPVIDGDWWNVTDSPDLGPLTGTRQQPVDFAVWQAADGTFQLWSCIRGIKAPGKSRLFHRWEAKNVTDTNWKPMGIAMQADPSLGEETNGLQAPHVIKDGGKYLMFYGSWNHICLAVSTDGKTFERVLNAEGKSSLFGGSLYNPRDPIAIKYGDLYICYYCAHEAKDDKTDRPKSAVFCRTSADLINWSEELIVSRGGSAYNERDWYGSDSECPFVQEIDGQYVHSRTQRYGQRQWSTVYSSDNPFDFGTDSDKFIVGSLPVAAPEIIKVGDQYYIIALKPGLDGMRAAKLRFDKKSFPKAQ